MGLFDKIKSAKNFLTGGGATVNVAAVNQINNGNEPVQVQIQVAVKDAGINVRNMYLRIRAVETVIARDIDAYQEEDGEFVRITEEVRNDVTTYEHELMFQGAIELDANSSHDFEAEFNVPAQIPGTFRGRNAFHEWQIYVGLDMAGNDPDSGWVDIEIAK